jgi:hypothetical protein
LPVILTQEQLALEEHERAELGGSVGRHVSAETSPCSNGNTTLGQSHSNGTTATAA